MIDGSDEPDETSDVVTGSNTTSMDQCLRIIKIETETETEKKQETKAAKRKGSEQATI